jgi:hypothetical protein
LPALELDEPKIDLLRFERAGRDRIDTLRVDAE